MQKYITAGRYTIHYAASQDSNLDNQIKRYTIVLLLTINNRNLCYRLF